IHADRVLVEECLSLNESGPESLSARFQICATDYLAAIVCKFGIGQPPSQRSLVKAINKETRLLKFVLDKECCRSADALLIHTRCIVEALSDVVGPKGESAGIRLAI